MKKCLISVLVISLMLVFFGCETTGNGTETQSPVGSNTNDVQQTAAHAENSKAVKIHEVFPVTAGGGDSFFADFEEDLVVDASTDVPEQVPVYVNIYPTSQTGPKYEITTELKDLMKANLQTFLGCLYEAEAQDGFDIEGNEDGSYKVFYQRGQVEFRAGLTKTRIFTDNSRDIVPDVSGSLLENELIIAAMRYLDITDPIIKEIHSYADDGSISVYEYKLTQHSDEITEAMADNCFRYIVIEKYADSENVRIEIVKNDPAQASVDAVVSYDDVLSYIKEKYPDADDEQITTEVRYESTVEEGYFIPCYKVYIEQEASPEGIVNLDTVYISMVG